jgi:hypothetical protein
MLCIMIEKKISYCKHTRDLLRANASILQVSHSSFYVLFDAENRLILILILIDIKGVFGML